MTTRDDARQQSRRFLIASSITVFVVFVTRALAFPHSWWLEIEPMLGLAVGNADPAAGRPPAPGFPLYLELAELLMFKAKTPFVALVASAFVSCVAAAALLAAALRRVGRDAVGGALAALLVFMTPAMLVFSSTPAPEAAALLFYAIAILAAGRLLDGDGRGRLDAAILGAAAACCVGCQPEWAPAVTLLIAAPVVTRESRRMVALAIVVYGGALMLVFTPYARALGGEGALFLWLFRACEPLGSGAALALLDALGPPWLSVPVVLAAACGAFVALRAREWMLLLVIAPACVHFAFVAMRGSVREPVLAIVPVSVGMIALAARGLAELSRRTSQPVARIAIVTAYCLASWIWTAPLLRARLNAAPPPSKAAIWIDDHVERGALVLVADELAPHAAALISNARVVRLDAAGGEHSSAQYALVPGESSAEGAIVFSWPDSEPLRRLARSRFRVVSVVPLRPAPVTP